MTERHPVWQLLDKLQMDIRSMETKMNELRMHVAALDLIAEPRPTCPRCGIAFQSKLLAAEHLYQSHDGPIPEHYLAAERLAGMQNG